MIDLRPRLQAALGDAYQIDRELGGGGMSRVFLATEASLHRQVVIKVLPPELASEVSQARFKQEIELAAHLQHTNILPVLAAGARDDLLYYVMPFVSGESLRHRLTREGKLSVPDAVRILHEIADALSYAHAEGVIHRDIKPENILLLGNHAVLMDFGVARALAEARSGERLTETGMGVGTPGYMSPEQAAGERHIDARADVYALAVVGYEMLAGVSPFEGPTAQAVLAAHLTKTARPVREVRPEAPPAVNDAIARALAKDPAQRLHTAAEFRDALGIAVTGTGIAVPRPSPVRRFGIAAVGLVAVAAGAFYLLRGKPVAALDPNLLAVAPFDAVSSTVAEYREGLVTILSRSLDGAGPIRTISPTVVVRRWAGQSDPTSASALGHSTGAGLVVFGQVVTAGADSVRLSATIYDVRRERPAGEVEVRDERQRIDRIADTLAVRLLRELGRTRPVGAVRFASLGSTSLPAIKLFLQAEQFYRHGQWDSTLAYAQRAVAVDSNFTLALRRIANALGWSNADDTPMLLRAGARNHGLAPRESLLVTVDSLSGALSEGASAQWPLLRRLAGTIQEAVTRYPEDPEAWYMKGEMAFHRGGQVPPRLPARTGFDAFAKAIELESAFAPAYEHIVDLALGLQEPEAARRYAEAFLHLAPDRSASLRAGLDLLAQPETPSPATTAFLDTAPASQVWRVWYYLRSNMDSGEAAVAAARAFTASRHGVDSVDAERQQWTLARTLAYRGHLREAARELWAHRPWLFSSNITAGDLVTLGGLSADSAAGWLESLLRDGSGWAGLGLGWWASIGDTASLRRYERQAQAESRSAPPGSSNAEFWTYQATTVQPYLALAHRDTTRALTLFASLPDSLCRYCSFDRLKRAQLLSAQKQDREAAALLDEPLHDAVFATPTVVVWALERGRVNERLGNREKAVESYSFVAAVWRNADPELQPYVTEAKAALARLAKEGR